jgi:hypothetical protein
MIASTSSWGFYILVRDLFRWIHPWWLAALMVFGFFGLILLSAWVWDLWDTRQRQRRRELVRQRFIDKYGLDPDDYPRVRRRARTRVPTAHAPESGNCASWIPEGFE